MKKRCYRKSKFEF